MFLGTCLRFCTGTGSKQVNQQSQFWTSINSVYRFNGRWGMLADFLIRRNNFMADPGFYFIRGAANYWIKDNMTVAMVMVICGWHHKTGLANFLRMKNAFTSNSRLPLKPPVVHSATGKKRTALGNKRSSTIKKPVTINSPTGCVIFLVTIIHCSQKQIPCLPLYWPMNWLSNSGKEVVYNTFDQNRLFIGIKQKYQPQP